MLELAQQIKKIDLDYYAIVISDIGWLILFCVICRRQIRRSCLQRRLLATLLLIINIKKKKEKKKKKIQKTFCKHLLGILVGFP